MKSNVNPNPNAEKILELMLIPPEQRDGKIQNELATLLMPFAKKMANVISYKAHDNLYIDRTECESAITARMVKAIQNNSVDPSTSAFSIMIYFKSLCENTVADLQKKAYGRVRDKSILTPVSLEQIFPDGDSSHSNVITSLQDHKSNPLNILIARETPDQIPSVIIGKLKKILSPQQFSVVESEIKRKPDTTTQKQAAEELNMNYRTYGVHLSNAMNKIISKKEEIAEDYHKVQKTR
jgi:hypothetical protein